MILVFSGRENGVVFLLTFFEHLKEILKPTDLNPFLFGQAFAISVSGSFLIDILEYRSVNDYGAKLSL